MLLANANVYIYFLISDLVGMSFFCYYLYCSMCSYCFGVVCFLLCRVYGRFINLRLVSDFFCKLWVWLLLDLLSGCCVVGEDLFCACI